MGIYARFVILLLTLSTLWSACEVFEIAHRDSSVAMEDSLLKQKRSYKFLSGIRYKFDTGSDMREERDADDKKRYGRLTQGSKTETNEDALHDLSKRALSRQNASGTQNATPYLGTKDMAIKGNTLTIDTFYQRIIVNNREILTLDTVVVANVKLFNSILAWLGTKYKYGGNSQKNIDCSALTRALTLTAYGISIPRTSIEQHRQSQKIKYDELQEGDLIFFATRRRRQVSHVSLYLSDDYFIHAGTSSGVTLSSLKTPYWDKRIIGYGRFVGKK